MNDNLFFAYDDRLLFEEDDSRPTRQFEIDPDRIIIGLDSSKLPVRAVVAEIVTREEGGDDLCPLGCATFDDLEDFANYWDHNWNFSGVFVAMPDGQADPLGIRNWLENEGYPVEEYSTMTYRSILAGDLTLLNMAIGPEFEPAYALAIHTLYRRNAVQVLNRIWTKLYEAEFLFQALRLEAHRLGAALESTPF